MPDVARTIIVSGGIEAAPPFTLDFIPKVVNTSPDVLSDSIMHEDVTATPRIIVGTDPSDAATSVPLPTLATDGVIYPSGGLPNSVAIGRQIDFDPGANGLQIAVGARIRIDSQSNPSNVRNVVLGTDLVIDDLGLIGLSNNVIVGHLCNIRNQASNNVLVGLGHIADGQDNNCVLIGNTSTLLAPNIGSLVAIGNGTSVSSRSVAIGDRATAGGALVGDCVGIGQQAVANGPQAVAVGRISGAAGSSAVAVGAAANAAFDESCAYGHNSQTTAANQFVVGGIGLAAVDTVIFGAGDSPNQSPTFANLTIRTSNIPSAGVPNLAGASITMATGTGIGNAIGGAFIVEVPQAVASGTGVQTVATGLQVLYSGTATETYVSIFDVDNGTLERVSVGAADSGGVGFKLLRIPN